MKKALVLWWQQLVATKGQVSFYEWLIYKILIGISLCYRSLFWFLLLLKQVKSPLRAHIPVVSVGNIVVGGSGKSVVVRALIDQFRRYGKRGIVIMRGYGSVSGKDPRRSVLVHDQSDDVGDEALMQHLLSSCDVFVSPTRALGYQHSRVCVAQNIIQPPDIIVLDDGYQHFSLAKSFEMLLIDARNPFGHNELFPAGLLREKDLSRAHCILLTHSNRIPNTDLVHLTHHIKNIIKVPVISVFHRYAGMLDPALLPIQVSREGAWVVAAGLGSIQGFLTSVNESGYAVSTVIEYDDHHSYTACDIEYLIDRVRIHKSRGVLTSAKDMVKIAPLLDRKFQIVEWVALDVQLDFLTPLDGVLFAKIVQNLGDQELSYFAKYGAE